ncbi:hypothetical protein ACU4GA_29075 [Methylobacterium oryzae CBMB20]
MKYAFFPDKRRLLVDRDGQVSTYDSGVHRIGGVAQADGAAKTLTFTGQDGDGRPGLPQEARLSPAWTGRDGAA